VTFDGLVARGSHVFIQAEYEPIIIENSDIQGADFGIWDQRDFGGLVVQDTYLRNDTDVQIQLSRTVGFTGPFQDDGSPLKTTVLRNVQFDAPAGQPLHAITMSYQFDGLNSWVPVLGNITEVYDYNQVPGDDFQLYFNEQRPGFVVPYTGDIQADPGFFKKGAPARGLSNQQTWDLYGIAIAGAVAPADATTRDGIDGLIGPLTDSPASPSPNPFGLAPLVPALARILPSYEYNPPQAGAAQPPTGGHSPDFLVPFRRDEGGEGVSAPGAAAVPETGPNGQRGWWDSAGLALRAQAGVAGPDDPLR
jgi:hypothetical protein